MISSTPVGTAMPIPVGVEEVPSKSFQPSTTSKFSKREKSSNGKGLFLFKLLSFSIALLFIIFSSILFTLHLLNINVGTNGSLNVSGIPVNVGITDFHLKDGGAIRATQDNSVARTGAIVSIASFRDLLDLPIEVVSSVERLNFMTAEDGSIHTYRIAGSFFGKDRSLTFLSAVDTNTSIIITEGKAVLRRSKGICSAANAEEASYTEHSIVLPDHKRFRRHRRQLREKDDDLDRRCSKVTGACLHKTVNELVSLTAFEDFETSGKRRLSDAASSASYATLSFDSYFIESATGYVDWETQDPSSAESDDGGSATEVDDDQSTATYDEWGCLLDDDYTTVAYPLTRKHCFRFVKTASCDYTLDGTSAANGVTGFELVVTDGDYDSYSSDIEGGSAFFLNDEFEACDTNIDASLSGFCECGSGFKIPSGQCGSVGTCTDICLNWAVSNDMTAVDLHAFYDTRYESKFNIDSLLTSDFFTQDEVVEGSSTDGYYVGVQNNVYFSMRLAYRRETPWLLGKSDWPSSVDYDSMVFAHHEHSTFESGDSVWKDSSGKGHHASITGTMNVDDLGTSGTATEDQVRVLQGDENTVVHFHPDCIPSVLGTLVSGGEIVFDGTNVVEVDLSATVAEQLNGEGNGAISSSSSHEQTFGDWYSEGLLTNDGSFATRFASHSYTRACQDAVINESSCDRHFDAFYADYDDVKTDLDVGLADIGAGLGGWFKCADHGEACSCMGNGSVRFGDPDTNSWTTLDAYTNGFTCGAAAFGIDTSASDDSKSCFCEATAEAVGGLLLSIYSDAEGDATAWLYSDWSNTASSSVSTALNSVAYLLSGDTDSLQAFSSSGEATNALLDFWSAQKGVYTDTSNFTFPFGDASAMSPHCRCIDTSSNDIGHMSLSWGEYMEYYSESKAENAGSIYTLEAYSGSTSQAAPEKHYTLFHVARYDPSGSNWDRIFVNNNSDDADDGDWFDGFDSGLAGVANHHDDFIAVTENQNLDWSSSSDSATAGWTVSSSSAFSYRSNFVSRLVTANSRTNRSLRGVKLAINTDSSHASDFQVVEVIVVHSDEALTYTQTEEIELYLLRKNMRLFMRSHMKTDTFDETATAVWKDDGLNGFDVNLSGGFALSLDDSHPQGGKVVAGTSNTSSKIASFDSNQFPATLAESTGIVVSKNTEFTSAEDQDYANCLTDETDTDWHVNVCPVHNPADEQHVITITMGATSGTFQLCEVQVFNHSSKHIAHSSDVDSHMNLAVGRTSNNSAGNDGDKDSCVELDSNDEFTLTLDPSVVPTRILVYSKSTGNDYTVKYDGSQIGAVENSNVLTDLKVDSNVTVPTYHRAAYDGLQMYAFSPDDHNSHRYSIWIASDQQLAVCEVEIYGQSSVFARGSANNPNVALVGSVQTSALDSDSLPQSYIVDGDDTTCALTSSNGIFRVDLEEGVAPYSVRIKMDGNYCNSAQGQIKLYLGTRYTTFEILKGGEINWDCNTGNEFVRSTSVDIGEPTLTVQYSQSSTQVCNLDVITQNEVGSTGSVNLLSYFAWDGRGGDEYIHGGFACKCNNGMFATGSDCTSNGAEICTSCNQGWYLNNGLCVENQCMCNDGVASLGSDCLSNGAHLCSSCNNGFHLNDSLCVENVCSCSNGTAATGTNCTTNGQEDCASCNTGFYLNDSTCVENVCSCSNGTATTGTSCATNGAHLCSSCNSGFHLNDSLCVENVCSCSNGTAATGTNCTTNGQEDCASCNTGFYLNDSTCVENVCSCSNGTATTGTSCATNGAHLCSSCNSGFHLNDSLCVENVCSCSNGTAATGTN
eukprot:g6081.t1